MTDEDGPPDAGPFPLERTSEPDALADYTDLTAKFCAPLVVQREWQSRSDLDPKWVLPYVIKRNNIGNKSSDYFHWATRMEWRTVSTMPTTHEQRWQCGSTFHPNSVLQQRRQSTNCLEYIESMTRAAGGVIVWLERWHTEPITTTVGMSTRSCFLGMHSNKSICRPQQTSRLSIAAQK